MSTFSSYFEKKSIAFLMLGISSGVPLALTMSTLTLWLSVFGVSKTEIGLFALVGLPYSLKFLWSPIFDNFKAPIFSKFLGFRSAWVVLSQMFVILCIILMSFANPQENLLFIAIAALALAFCSSCADIATDAYRIDLFEGDKKGVGGSMYVFGYRIGLLIASVGVIHVTSLTGENWQLGYLSSIIGILIGTVSVFILKEEKEHKKDLSSPTPTRTDFEARLVAPFADFMKNQNLWALILLFILSFKLGDAYVGIMNNKFLIELGYSKEQIVNISKIVGLVATICGTFVGSAMLQKLSITRSLFIAIFLQSFSNLVFIYQESAGVSNAVLSAVTFTENFTSGIGSIIIISYLSSMCNLKYSATQYAILSSVSSVGRTLISSSAGLMVENVGWTNFFIFSIFAGLIPALILMKLSKSSKHVESSGD